MKKNIDYKTIISVLGAPIVLAIVILSLYFIKGIYPFGEKNISYYDLAQYMTPLYYHTYDVLHGTKDLFWDWYSATGELMTDTVGNFVLNPFNLFFLFVKRDMILESLSFFLLIKVCVCAGTMSFYTKKKFPKINCVWHILMGLLYASCGFMIQYYTIIQFLDLVALFPILIYFVDKLCKDRKIFGYIICMSLGFITNIYMMFMICIYLILYVSNMVKKQSEQDKQDKISLFGCSTAVSIAVSAVIFIPTLIALLNSSRASIHESDTIMSYVKIILFDWDYENRLFMLFGCELPFAILLVFFIFYRKKIVEFSIELKMILLLTIPVFVKLTNVLWHPGGYVDFPMRFAFMLTFTGMLLMGNILQYEYENDIYINKHEKLKYLRIPVIASIPFTIIALYYFFRCFLQFGIRDTSYYTAYWSIFGFLFGMYALIHASGNKKIIPIICSILVITQIGMGWYGFLAPVDMYSPECEDTFIKNSESIKGIFDENFTDRCINRVKDESISLNANYPFVLEKASMSNWTWGAKPAVKNLAYNLGYSSSYTRILDNGGTLFSDSLFHLTNLISYEQPNDAIYEFIEEKNGYYFSKLKNTYPFGILVNKNIMDLKYAENSSRFEYQNQIFESLNEHDNNLISIYNMQECIDAKQQISDNDYKYTFNIEVDSKSVLYIDFKNTNNMYLIYVNGNMLNIPALEDKDNALYPSAFVNGLINCGIFDDEKVELTIESIVPLEEDDISFGALNLSVLHQSIYNQLNYERNIEVGKKSLHMEIQNDSFDYIMLPIGYDSSTKVMVNGEKIKPLSIFEEAFYLIPIEQGKNEVKMVFQPKGINIGIIISIIGVISVAGLLFWKEKIVSCKPVQSLMYILLNIMEKGIILLLYIIPILITIGVKIWFHFYLLKQ